LLSLERDTALYASGMTDIFSGESKD